MNGFPDLNLLTLCDQILMKSMTIEEFDQMNELVKIYQDFHRKNFHPMTFLQENEKTTQ
jgi:hypothetical protein